MPGTRGLPERIAILLDFNQHKHYSLYCEDCEKLRAAILAALDERGRSGRERALEEAAQEADSYEPSPEYDVPTSIGAAIRALKSARQAAGGEDAQEHINKLRDEWADAD